MTTEARHLGTVLVQNGLMSREQLDRALEAQRASGLPLGRVLVDEGYVHETDLVKTLAHQIGMDYIDLDEVQVDPAAAALLPEALARRYLALPVAYEDGKLVVAMADPANVLALDDIRHITGAQLLPKVATRSGIIAAASRLTSLSEGVGSLTSPDETEDVDDAEDIDAVDEAPVVKLVNTVINRAVVERASDIHIEPGEHDLRIRFRIDGVLKEVMTTPRSITSAVVSRLKIMADINIAEKRIPQDGRISLKLPGKSIDLRVATLPGIWGEKVVLRILDKSSGVLNLSDLGFLPDTLERFAYSYNKPYGAILVTGPTGSGKSTTLYATLNVLNRPEVNIITVEDPVEYRLSGINQVQVNKKAGLTFASALRSILRSDPDVALVGEIRDGETAKIAIEAALTGHLVLSTLHTNDAPSSVGRLIEMGIEPYLVASALDCVLAQRLVRRLCNRCKVAYQPTQEELTLGHWPDEWPAPTQLYKAIGCVACANTGYRGRFAIHEVMAVTEEIQRMAVEHRPSDDIKRMAITQGMRQLFDDGLKKVEQGHTSLTELRRVVV